MSFMVATAMKSRLRYSCTILSSIVFNHSHEEEVRKYFTANGKTSRDFFAIDRRPALD